ncbi:MAG: LuxR family transcriptional regulator [Syntrophaceticus sp.]
MVSGHSLELLARLQSLQDQLAKKTGLSLVLVNSQGEEVTIPSRLPIICNEPGQKDKCQCEIKRFIKQSDTQDEAAVSKCYQGLYVFSFKPGIQFARQKIYLIGGRTKDVSSIEDELDLITAVYRLPITIDPALQENSRSQSKDVPVSGALENLTPRELDVLRFLGMGYTNKMIASQLYISPNTVKAHVSTILSKLGVASRTEAVLVAIKNNLVKRDQFVEEE